MKRGYTRSSHTLLASFITGLHLAEMSTKSLVLAERDGGSSVKTFVKGVSPVFSNNKLPELGQRIG